MSVSNISSSYGHYQASGDRPPRKPEIDALDQALQTGDISSAQQAFSALFSANGNQAECPANSSSNSNSSEGIVADISALGKALASGDLTSAQSAFSSLQEDIQNTPPPPPPRQSNSADSATNSDAVQSLFDQLAEALESGDLSAAQSAFSSLQAAAPENQSDSTSSTSNLASSSTAGTTSTDTIGTDLDALSDALQSGDLTSAQSLFETLLADLQANAPRHSGLHHYAQNSSSDSTATTSVSVSA